MRVYPVRTTKLSTFLICQVLIALAGSFLCQLAVVQLKDIECFLTSPAEDALSNAKKKKTVDFDSAVSMCYLLCWIMLNSIARTEKHYSNFLTVSKENLALLLHSHCTTYINNA